MKLTGRIVKGFDEGAFFVRKYAPRIKAATGLQPFYGTLNVETEGEKAKEAFLKGVRPVVVSGFSEGNRSFGSISLYRVSVQGIEGFAIKPERSRHDKAVVEVIAAVSLKQKFGLQNGDKIELEN